MKIILLLGLMLINSAFAEVLKGSCRIEVNGYEHEQRMLMLEDENVITPIMINVQNGSNTPRKLRIIYDYTDTTREMNIKFVDCNHMYQPPGTSMNICSHLFSIKQTVPLKQAFEIVFGGSHSSEPEIKVNCLRDKD